MSSRTALSSRVSFKPKYKASCLPLRLYVKAPSPSTKPVTYQASKGVEEVPRENVSMYTFSRGTWDVSRRPYIICSAARVVDIVSGRGNVAALDGRPLGFDSRGARGVGGSR